MYQNVYPDCMVPGSTVSFCYTNNGLSKCSCQRYSALLESVERETIASIKQEWIYNVCGKNRKDIMIV
jgi:hypothetical protein